MLEEVTIDILTEVGGADGAEKKSEFHLLSLILHHLVSVLVPHFVKITFHLPQHIIETISKACLLQNCSPLPHNYLVAFS